MVQLNTERMKGLDEGRTVQESGGRYRRAGKGNTGAQSGRRVGGCKR